MPAARANARPPRPPQPAARPRDAFVLSLSKDERGQNVVDKPSPGFPVTYPQQSWADPRLETRPSPIGGLGGFASAPIAAGETLLILGGTPQLVGRGRGREIDQWLIENRGVGAFAIVDDDEDAGSGHPHNFVQTTFEEGLTRERVDALVRVLTRRTD